MRRQTTCCGLALAAFAATAHGADSGDQALRLAAGQKVYAVQCAACHGARGEGQSDWDRPNPSGDLPAPPHNQTGHTWKHSDAMLYRILSNGWRDPFNKSHDLTMPGFGKVLSPAQRRDVLNYLKTMWTPEQRLFQSDESKHAPFPPEVLHAP